MKFLDRYYPKVPEFGNLRQGTLTFAKACLEWKRDIGQGHLWSLTWLKHPTHGRRYHCLRQAVKFNPFCFPPNNV